MLNYFDIFGSIKENFTRGSNIYNLTISAKYSRQYQESIGSQVHCDKLQALVDYIDRDNAHDLSDEIDKINGLGAIIAKCGKTLKLPGQSRNYGRWAKKDTIGRRTLQKYIQVFESHENSGLIKDELRILNQAANSGVVWDEVKKIEKQWSDKAASVVAGLKAQAEARGLKAKAVTVRSDLVAESIIAAAKKHKCDLIVMATHGRGAFGEFLFGSETKAVLAGCKLPLLVLR
jgi:nucleotide-binding universal stress UspA family protein